MKTKYHCETLLPWLRANGHQLGCLTGQSSKALAAAVQCVALWAYCDDEGERCAVQAFGACVRAMPAEQRYLAYHAIAHVTDWGQRGKLWSAAGLTPIAAGRCTHEPRATRDEFDRALGTAIEEAHRVGISPICE